MSRVGHTLHRLSAAHPSRHGLSTLRLFRRGSLVLLIVAALATVETPAWAHWTAAGSGTGPATTGTLHFPTSLSASASIGSRTVNLTWIGSALSSGTPAQGYYLARIRNSDS